MTSGDWVAVAMAAMQRITRKWVEIDRHNRYRWSEQPLIRKGTAMQSLAARIKNEWIAIVLAVWMIAVSGYLLYLNSTLQEIRQMTSKLSSDVDSVESILISTDNNVSEMKKRIDEMSAKVDILHKRIRRR